MKKSEIVQRLVAIEKHIGIATEETKLEVGKWYKHQCGSIAYLGNEGTFSYGLSIYDSEGNMSDILHWIDYEWDVKYSSKGWTKASPQEVEEALVKEAKRRYKVGDKVRSIQGRYTLTTLDCKYIHDSDLNGIYSTQGYGVWLFLNGTWSEILEKSDQPVDKFAELKEAHRNGTAIQRATTHTWVDDLNPTWDSYHEYRIKPEEKPKVGDVVKAWSRNEDHYVVGNLTDINKNTDNKYGVHILGVSDIRNTIYYANAKPLTKQEAIELLFGKGE